MTDGNNECFVLCSICGGECCRTKPGIDSPTRYVNSGDPVAALVDALSSGLWVLDRHRGIPVSEERDEIFYPRPATTAERGKGPLDIVDGPCECAFLEEEGCSLSFGERPEMCRALEPEVNFECTTSWTRKDAALAWLPLQHAVDQALERLGIAPTGGMKPYSPLPRP